MSAIFSIFKVVPGWCWAILIVVAALLGAELHGRHVVQVKWDAEVKAQREANDLLVDKRREDNRALAAKQLLDSSNIQREHDEEVANARAAAARSERMRIGTAICPTTGSTEASGTSGGNGANTGTRLVPDDVDRDIWALEIKVEGAFAAGRAAQAFIRANGMAPQTLLGE
ncbi:hypothetical protein hmeg3_07675 [Herbaspirillum sp. meg3]|uniref:hypothetical protein n=1 Tax=Herbaspirillum sp. meg3 TaxID=2025949 RepID=UPI000B993F65|nr:hypothetical protein [Herbaspirillum sp. meg3]ASU38188.1 hypothetical protein hmeg3_07675 [Herbaspirillum sp. meg3]